MANHEDKLLDHNYDGIRELDNNLPPWWLKLFYLTIIWAVLYVLYFHVFRIGDLSAEEYKKEMDPNYKSVRPSIIPGYNSPWASNQPEITPLSRAQNAEMNGQNPQPVAAAVEEPKEEEKVYTLITDPAQLAEGKKIFEINCFTCHGKHGEGGIGPNLTDDYWIHGKGKFNDIVKVVTNGVPIKGMITWRGILPEKSILEVASYVHSLRGTNPPNPKAPQGEKVSE